MSKRNVAVRQPEDVTELVQAVARVEDCTASDVYREAIRTAIASKAAEHPEFAEQVQKVAQARLERNLEEISGLFGEQVLAHLEIPKPSAPTAEA